MDPVFVLVVLGVMVAGNMLARRAVRPRGIDTALPPERLRVLFEESVLGMGWRIVDDGNPMVAQSTLLAGIRQRIGLSLERKGDRTLVTAEVLKYDGQWVGVPRRPYTLWMRLNRFVAAVTAEDPTARVSG